MAHLTIIKTIVFNTKYLPTSVNIFNIHQEQVMSYQSNKGIIYSNYLGYSELLKTIINSLVCKFLNYRSRQHLVNDEQQVVVFAFDFIGHQINLKGFYERQELLTAFKFLSENNLINGFAVDVGANIGNHSLFFRKYFKKVFSFEPNHRTFKVLTLNVELMKNIECFNVGLSDSARSAFLNINSGNVGGSYISTDESYRNSTQQQIQLKTLDSFMSAFTERLGLLKIDVEGHELAVLQGGKEIILRDKPIIFFEQQVENFIDGKSPVYEYLKSIGYSTFLTIKASPNVSPRLSKPIKNLVETLLRLIFGLSYDVKVLGNIQLDSYPFIISLPD